MFLAKLTPETPPTAAAKEATANQKQAEVRTMASLSDSTERQSRSRPRSPRSITPPATSTATKTSSAISSACTTPATGTRTGARRARSGSRAARSASDGTNGERWYYLTRDGDLFRWDDIDAPMAALARLFTRAFWSKEIHGTLVHAFGPVDGYWYHANPRRLRASSSRR